MFTKQTTFAPIPHPSPAPEEQAVNIITGALDTVMMEAFGGQSISGQRFIAKQLRAALEFLGNDAVNRITHGVVNHYGATN
jgi:hypothetical protein